jgi:hypothetical protein
VDAARLALSPDRRPALAERECELPRLPPLLPARAPRVPLPEREVLDFRDDMKVPLG